MTYQIIYVTFTPDGREYSYLTDDETIAAGDHVIVPTGGENEEKLARVTRTDTVTEETAPYPVGKMKKVLRKLSANFMDDDAMPASISDAIAGTLREKITEWTDWGTNQCIAPEEDFDTYRELVLKGAEKGWTEALEALKRQEWELTERIRKERMENDQRTALSLDRTRGNICWNDAYLDFF